MFSWLRRCFLLSVGLCSTAFWAGTAAAVDWNAHYQATYIEQRKNAFNAAYSGANSLSTDSENSYSFTATAYWGLRPWSNGELYLNPEVTRGVPLSNLVGLGGFTNGEMARTSGPTFKLYRARLFLRQSWNLGGGPQQLDDGPNQLPESPDRQRFVLTLGNLSMLDVFDPNSYSHDGRVQFFNWALINYGAYDFAADARGYTWAAIGELYRGDWALRFGRGMLPQQPNGQALDTRVFKHFGDQFEIERTYALRGQAGAAHLLGFHDRAQMARYRDALALASQTNTVPDINAVRKSAQDKYGLGVSIEQAINGASGGFLRAMWADGKTETEAYATIDRSVAAGLVGHGSGWNRAADSIGLAYAWNALSRQNRRYLEAGGQGFFIGDGQLRYGLERIAEGYYDLNVAAGWWLTADLQRIVHPAYNRDRGPVTVPAMRVHAEF